MVASRRNESPCTGSKLSDGRPVFARFQIPGKSSFSPRIHHFKARVVPVIANVDRIYTMAPQPYRHESKDFIDFRDKYDYSRLYKAGESLRSMKSVGMNLLHLVWLSLLIRKRIQPKKRKRIQPGREEKPRMLKIDVI